VREKIVIGVTGMPGAGKATIRRMAEKMSYPTVVMGDEIREKAKRRGLKPTPENLGMLMLKLREEKGLGVVAELCVPKIKESGSKIVIVDGIRSLDEIEEFRRHFPNFLLIAIHTSPKARFERLFQRRRSDDPSNWETFMERDSRELSVGLGSVIATADYLIVNEGTKSQLRRKVRKVLEGAIKGE